MLSENYKDCPCKLNLNPIIKGWETDHHFFLITGKMKEITSLKKYWILQTSFFAVACGVGQRKKNIDCVFVF